MDTDRKDQVAQFVVILGDSCEAARLADLPVSLVLDDGSAVEGVPSEPTNPRSATEEFDHSGTSEWLELSGTVVMTARVRSFSVALPN